MLLIRKSLIIGLAAVSFVSTILIAVTAYLKIIGSEGLTGAELRFAAEEYLFTGILLSLIMITAFIFLIRRSRNISRELDRLIRQEKLNPASTETGLLKLGAIGDKLNLLYRQIDEVSEMRGLKISALSNTTEFLSSNVGKSIIITDVTGRILEISRGYIDKSGVSRSEILERNIESIIHGVEIKTVLARLEKKRLPTSFSIKGIEYTWRPIYNRNNEISYIAVTQSDDNPN